jgi:hypothetical protein
MRQGLISASESSGHLSRYRRRKSAGFARGLDRRSVVRGNIHVGVVKGRNIFDLAGNKLYNLKGDNIYRLSGELVGHISAGQGTEKRLDRSTDRLFPAGHR